MLWKRGALAMSTDFVLVFGLILVDYINFQAECKVLFN